MIFKRFDPNGKKLTPMIKVYSLSDLRKFYKRFNSNYFVFKEYIKYQKIK